MDCKGGIIVSGSRDRTAKVRWSALTYGYSLQSIESGVGEGGWGLESQDWLRALVGAGVNNTIKDSLMCLWRAACHARLCPCQSGQWLGLLPLT